MIKKPRVEPDKVRKQRFWKELWQKAVDRSKELEDPRYPLLLRYQKTPEQILRKLNIICMNDVEREFK